MSFNRPLVLPAAQRQKGTGEKIMQGLSLAGQSIPELIGEYQKDKEREEFRKRFGVGQKPPSPEDKNKQFMSMISAAEQQTGQKFTPEQVNQFQNQFQLQQQQPSLGFDQNQATERLQNLTPEDLILSQKVAPELLPTLTELYKAQESQRLQQKKTEFQREKSADPQIKELTDSLETREAEALRFDRLGQLFSPENDDKFPSAFTVGLFTKDGELRPTVAATLSPEAQEAVKLITDNISDAKGTFGARVTNFDLQTYLKRLPSLLNTAEGRRSVLRDLQIINKLNQMRDEGILDVIEEHGGPGKISVSKAKQIFRKRKDPQIQELKKQFINPNRSTFSSLPQASLYKGKKIQDESTGQILVSDGNEWVPQGGE